MYKQNAYGCSKTIVYPPVPPEYNKLHNMFADKNGNAIILETAISKSGLPQTNKTYG